MIPVLESAVRQFALHKGMQEIDLLHLCTLSGQVALTLFLSLEDWGGGGMEQSGLAVHLANGATTPCHAHPWRKYKNVRMLSLFPVICMD